MKCVLHIGTEKTGTTSIQSALEKNAADLLGRRILYPAAFHGHGHIKISCYALDNDHIDLRKRRRGLIGDAVIEPFREAFARALRQEVDAARGRADVAVIVNEHLSRLINPSEVARLKAFLDNLFDEVEIYLYIRRQDLLMRSMYSTVVKVGGHRRNVFPAHDPAKVAWDFKIFDYHRIFRLWTAAFPREAFHVRHFDRAKLAGGNVIVDFLAAAGLVGADEAADYVVPEENPSLDPLVLEVLRRFNAAWQEAGYDRAGFAGIGAQLARLHPGRGKPVTRSEAEAFLAPFAESNRALARDCFGADELFDTSDLAALPETVEPVDPGIDDVMRILAAAWHIRFTREEEERKRRQERARKSGGTG